MSAAMPKVVDVPAPVAPLVVVGDVHLAPAYPAVREEFIALVRRRAAAGGTLVLLGDLFDYWIGRPQAEDPFLKPVFDALREAAGAGLRLVFQAGNRDFIFDGAPGLEVELWPELVRTEVGGRRMLFTHGDLLCTSDRSYLRFRRLVRSPGGAPRIWARRIPFKMARYLAEGLRRFSARETQRKPKAYMDIDYGTAREWLDATETEVLVAGHVHTGVHHVLAAADEAGESKEVLVLKDWERGGGVITFDGGRGRLVAPDAV